MSEQVLSRRKRAIPRSRLVVARERAMREREKMKRIVIMVRTIFKVFDRIRAFWKKAGQA